MTVQPPEQPIPRDLPISPDCSNAPFKCGACSGDAWDDALDELTACACPYGIDDLSWRGEGKPQRLHRGPSRGGGWRGLWGQWAADVHGALWNVTTLDLDAIPDPPTREDHP